MENYRLNIPILLYHRIDWEKNPKDKPFCVSPENFEKQMSWMKKKGYESINLDEYYRMIKNREVNRKKVFIITFDDGYYCNYAHAFPVLKKYGY